MLKCSKITVDKTKSRRFAVVCHFLEFYHKPTHHDAAIRGISPSPMFFETQAKNIGGLLGKLLLIHMVVGGPLSPISSQAVSKS